MPAHHTLSKADLDAYIEAAGIRDGGKAPLFHSAVGRTGTLMRSSELQSERRPRNEANILPLI